MRSVLACLLLTGCLELPNEGRYVVIICAASDTIVLTQDTIPCSPIDSVVP